MGRVDPVHQRRPEAGDHGEHGGPTDGRIVRTRTMTRAEADRELVTWRAAGAQPIPAQEGVVALERSRRDTLTGTPRRLRLAVAAGDPAQVLNWSALEPIGTDDTAVWRAALARLQPGTAPPPPPDPHLGWTA
ncbi:MAG: hypothetical protein U0Y82_11415 [Thermoleophilia bacterium]